MNKHKIITAITAFLLAGGVTLLNVEEELPQHPIKEYSFRSLDRPLYITFHHSVTTGKSLKDIAQYHIDKGWPGIAYHFAINDKGEVFQLQKIEEITYHSKGHNTESIGVVFLGNYQESKLTNDAICGAEQLVMALEESLNIVGVRGHRDVRATLCPGQYAYDALQHLFK